VILITQRNVLEAGGWDSMRGVEALTSTSPMAIFSRAQFATPVSHVTKDNIINTLNKVGVNFQRTKKSYALFWFS